MPSQQLPRVRALGIAFACAAIAVPSRLEAQCPDGTPPPCEVRARQAVARAAAPTSAAERGRRFLVLPFRNIARTAEHDWLVEGSPSLLADALGQWEDLYVVPPERLFPALRRHGLQPGAVMDETRVRRVAEETRGWTAVTGELLSTGTRLRISIRAYDVTSGRVVTRAAEDVGAGDDVRDAYLSLSRQLLRSAGLEAAPNAAVATTSSLEAYQAYLRGQAHYNRAEFAQARTAFEEAVRIDTAYARAWMKLAEASMTTIESFVNPQSDAYRFAARATALSQRLQPRDRDLVQSLSDMLAGQLGSARERLLRLVQEDSNHVEALERLSGLEQFDPVIVERSGAERPRGSLNESVRLAKRVIELDPGRQSEYMTLISSYALAAGTNYGRVAGIRGERPSVVATFQAMNTADRVWVALLRDSIVLVPAESLAALPADSVTSWRNQARLVAAAWSDRWLAAAPRQGLAYRSASEIAALGGDFGRALALLARAESLGVEYEMLANFTTRRLEYLIRGGRLREALALADSLVAGPRLRGQAFVATIDPQQEAAWIFNLYLRSGRLREAEEIATRLRDVSVAVAGLQPAQAQAGVICFYACLGDATNHLLPNIPDTTRVAAVDSLLAYADRLPRDGMLAQTLTSIVASPARNSPATARERAPGLMARAAELAQAGRSDLAVSIGIGASWNDSSAATQLVIHEGFRAASAADPTSSELRYQVGRFAAVTGSHLEEAEQALTAYLAAPPPAGAPSHAAAAWRLGQVYERMNRADRARESYERSLQLDSSFTAARQALDRLPR